MVLEEIFKKREAVRNYLEKDVSEDLIKKILKLASLSPSAGNLQARRVIIVKNPAIRKKLKVTCSGLGRFTIEPPVIFVICSVPEESAIRYGDRGRNLYALQDATIFASYLQLAAVSLGLASCWVGSFDENKVSEILNIPKNLVPVVMIPVGFSEEEPGEKSRKILAELVFKEI
ncbi:nitroreductase family protein [Candidatus Daviesbacteria bacterium]|nr:nitroreductase family protein [Candidatus Daviesbacteria bacterium]